MSEATTSTVKVRCPSCNKKLGFPAAAAGKKARCPGCAHTFRVEAPASPAASRPSRAAEFSQASERIRTACPACGKKLTFLMTALGRKAKCAACEHTFVVTAPDPEAPADAPAAPRHRESSADDEQVDLFGDFAAAEQNADLVPLSEEEAAFREAAMTGPEIVDARKPIKLDYAQEVSEYEEGIVARVIGALGPLGKGCSFSFIGAAIGGVVWAVVGISLELEIGYVALLVGLLAGLGMNLGTKSESVVAGSIAAGFSFLGIFLGKLLIVGYLLYPLYVAAQAAANPNSPESQRHFLVEYRTKENLEKMNVNPMRSSEKQEKKAQEDAEASVGGLSDAEVRTELDKYKMLEKRETLVGYKTQERLRQQNAGASQRQYAVIQGMARQDVAKLSDAAVERELARYEAAALEDEDEEQGDEADEDDAEQQATASTSGSTGAGAASLDEDEEEGGGMGLGFWALAIGAFFGIHGIIWLIIAMVTAFRIGGYGLNWGT